MTGPALLDAIVVGTDGSPCADRAVEWAAAEAVRRRRPLRVVHAVGAWDHGRSPGLPASLSGSPVSAGERILGQAADLAGKAGGEVEVTTELVFGSPAHALRAQAERAWEVVVGHRGLGGRSGLLLGSTGLRVAGRTPGPVVVVRGEHRQDGGEVLAGVDLSDESGRVLEYAFAAAASRDGGLRAVHTWEVPPTLFNGAYPVTVRQAATAARSRLAKVVALWRARFPGVTVVEEAPPGHVVDQLVKRSRCAGLLVVGSHRRGADAHAGTGGAVGHGLLRDAGCPVAVIGHRRQ